MKSIRTVALTSGIIIGALLSPVGATAASAQPSMTSDVRATSAPLVVPVSAPGQAHDRSVGSVPQSPATAEAPGDSRASIPVKPIIDWIKRNAPSIVPAMKNAVRGGINGFKNWWNGLAGWIRAGISLVAQGGINEIFSALWNYFFG